MAAEKTPSKVEVLEGGRGYVLRLCPFANIDNGDYWTVALPNVKTAVAIDKTGATTSGVGVSYASGKFTFTCATDDKAVDLLVYSN
jgi:hypothetical protein